MDQNKDNLTEGSLPGGADVTPSGDNAAASAVAPAPETSLAGMSLDELNATLGKNYPSKEVALKSIKDTFSYVGAKQQAPGQDLDQIVRERLESELLFVKNPELAPHRELAEAIAAKKGISVLEATQDASFKTYVEKTSGYDKSQEAKSVLQSNPRLGIVRDSMQEARELNKLANQANMSGDPTQAAQLSEQGRGKAVDAVLKAYDLKQ